AVVHGYIFLRCRIVFCQYLCNAVAEPTEAVMLFGGYHAPRFCCGFQHGRFIQWLDGMYIDDFGIDPQLGQLLARLDGFPHQVAGSKDANVGTFVHHPRLTNLKRLVCISKDRHYRTPEAEINGSVMVSDSDGGRLGLVVVAWIDE